MYVMAHIDLPQEFLDHISQVLQQLQQALPEIKTEVLILALFLPFLLLVFLLEFLHFFGLPLLLFVSLFSPFTWILVILHDIIRVIIKQHIVIIV